MVDAEAGDPYGGREMDAGDMVTKRPHQFLTRIMLVLCLKIGSLGCDLA